ncbi:hypothetical protein, partial [Anaerotignum faecicola]
TTADKSDTSAMQPEISLAAFLFFLIFFVLSEIWFMSKAFNGDRPYSFLRCGEVNGSNKII